MSCDNNGHIVNTSAAYIFTGSWSHSYIDDVHHTTIANTDLTRKVNPNFHFSLIHSHSHSLSQHPSVDISLRSLLFAFRCYIIWLGKETNGQASQPTEAFRARVLFQWMVSNWIACIIEFVCVFMRKILSVWHFLFFFSFKLFMRSHSFFLSFESINLSFARLFVRALCWECRHLVNHIYHWAWA